MTCDFKNENMWLMKGDCLDRMKEIPDGSVDMVLADVPFLNLRVKQYTRHKNLLH